MMFYAPKVFALQPGADYLPAIMSSINVVFAFIAIFLIGMFGRRPLLLFGSIACAVGHVICVVSLDPTGEDMNRNWGFNIGVFIYVAMYTITYGPLWYPHFFVGCWSNYQKL